MFDFSPAAATLDVLLAESLDSLRPPERVSLSEYARNKVWINNPSTAGRQLIDYLKTPYQVEILDSLSDPNIQGVRFVGTSRGGKTVMSVLMIPHTVETNPMDIMIVPPSRQAATTFAKDDLEKFFDENEWFRKQIRPGRTTDSLMMKKFRNGTILSIVWPSAKNLAGVNRGVICLPDYDRIKADVDGEGSVYSLADSRTKIYGMRKTIFVESSPSKNPDKFEKFDPPSPHAAPPYPGIFSLYNEGDRRWWYWRCFNCEEYFPAHPDHLDYDDEGTPAERAASARMICPCCGHAYTHAGDPEKGEPGKYELNLTGRWVPDGMSLDTDGNLLGEMLSPPRPGLMNYRSYWLFGVSAAFQTWEGMVLAKINAEAILADTGDDSVLKTVLNTDFGLPWIPPHIADSKAWEDYKDRAFDYEKGVVPEGARFCVTTVDSQGDHWVLQTFAVGKQMRSWCIDRRTIRFSDRDHESRRRADGTPEKAFVRPGIYKEDWQKLTQVLSSLKYPLHDDSGVMTPVIFGVDSGGKDATTANAYSWWRGLGAELPKSRVMLIKGDPRIKNFVEIRNPDDTKRKDRHAGGQGDVPVLGVSSDKIKDLGASFLDRQVDGPGFFHFPTWFKDEYFMQMCAEQKRGEVWVPIRKRNEAWDLFMYMIALLLSPKLKADLMDWDAGRIHAYAKPAHENPFVTPMTVNAQGQHVEAPAKNGGSPYLLTREQMQAQFQELNGG